MPHIKWNHTILAFSDWLILCSIMSTRFIYIVPCVKVFSLFRRIFHCLYISPLVDPLDISIEHLILEHWVASTFVNNFVVNMGVQMPF